MNGEVYIGIAITSHAGPSVSAEAQVSNVQVSDSVTPVGPFKESMDIGFLPTEALDLSPDVTHSVH